MNSIQSCRSAVSSVILFTGSPLPQSGCDCCATAAFRFSTRQKFSIPQRHLGTWAARELTKRDRPRSSDAEAYSRVQELHREFTKDPHYFAFFMVVNNLLTHISIPRKLTVGLIFDDDQEKAMRSYRLLKRLKQQIPEVRSRVTSICFSDDRDAPQVQAADLFTHLSRLEAMRIFAGVSYPYESLFHAFGAVMPTGEHLCMDARFFSEEVLRTFAATGKIREIVLARRVKLPH